MTSTDTVRALGVTTTATRASVALWVPGHDPIIQTLRVDSLSKGSAVRAHLDRAAAFAAQIASLIESLAPTHVVLPDPLDLGYSARSAQVLRGIGETALVQSHLAAAFPQAQLLGDADARRQATSQPRIDRATFESHMAAACGGPGVKGASVLAVAICALDAADAANAELRRIGWPVRDIAGAPQPAPAAPSPAPTQPAPAPAPAPAASTRTHSSTIPRGVVQAAAEITAGSDAWGVGHAAAQHGLPQQAVATWPGLLHNVGWQGTAAELLAAASQGKATPPQRQAAVALLRSVQ